jgi:Family of unknown function (DUF6131)
MIVLGIVLIILAALLPDLGLAVPGNILHIFDVLGVLLLVLGIIFAVLGGVGRPVAGRRWWY